MGNRRGLWLGIVLAFVVFVLIGAYDGAGGVILPSIQQTYNIDKATVSLMFLAGTAGYLVSAFLSGPLVEKLGTRLFLTSGLVAFLVGASLIAAALGFAVNTAAVFVLSFGIGILDAGLNAYIAKLPDNTGLLNYLHAFYGLGALLGPVIASGFLALALPWTAVYILWIGIAVPLLVGIWVAMRREREREAHEAAQHAETDQPEGNLLAAALKLRIVWLAAIFLLLYVGGEVSLGVWNYSLLTEERGQPPLVAGWTASGFWMGLTVGRLVLGRLAKRIGDKALVQGCMAGLLVGLLLVWLPPKEMQALSTVTGIAGLWIAGFSLGPIYPTTIAVMSRLVSRRILPGAIGFLASAGSMGAALFPWIAGNLAQKIGLWTLMPYVIGISVLLWVVWLLLQASPGAQTVESVREAA